ncbi:Arc family DNA-binding protein [Chromobacterium sinusclupearum]|nr:Arc family DNA-binding protein [Chromobacterium sinusclupearum]
MTHKTSGIHRSQYRFPQPVADWLKQQAATNFRSVNAELLAILHDAMQKQILDPSRSLSHQVDDEVVTKS